MEQENVHAHSPDELQRKLQDIEEELKKPVDRKKFERLFRKLEIAQKDCSLMKTRYTLSSEKFLSNCEEKICSLFGKVTTTHVDTEVHQILDQAQKLSSKNKIGAKIIQKKIQDLRKWHRPSKENLLKIAEAEKKLGIISPSDPVKEEDIDLEEAEHLLALASHVYHRKKLELNKSYLTLSQTAKERFNKHLISLKTKAFDKEKSTIQALFVSAFEMAGLPANYPSQKEIDEYFQEEKESTG